MSGQDKDEAAWREQLTADEFYVLRKRAPSEHSPASTGMFGRRAPTTAGAAVSCCFNLTQSSMLGVVGQALTGRRRKV